MRKRRWLNLSAVLLSCVTVAAQRPTSLRGQVTDQFGAAIVGATVSCTDAAGHQQTTQTGDGGEYRFDSVPPGAYKLAVRQKGFAPQAIDDFKIGAGTNVRDFQLTVTIDEQ